MSDRLSHLVFYDGTCGLCDKIVRFLFKEDQKQLFVFAPLQGETASEYLNKLPPEIRFTDTLVLVESFRSSKPQTYILGKGALRIAWLLGWPWMLIGWLSFFPGWLFNWAYRLIAKNRQRFFPNNTCFVPPKNQKDRFLP